MWPNQCLTWFLGLLRVLEWVENLISLGDGERAGDQEEKGGVCQESRI